MLIDLATLSPNRVYHTLIQSIIPRPIAWVLTANAADGHNYNLAPFSYFNAVCSDPPLLMLSIGRKPDGSDKDTRRNIRERKHFVVHLPHAAQAALVNASSAPLPAGASEPEHLGLALTPFGDFPLPRVRDCRAAFACELHQLMEVGEQAVLFGLVRAVYLDDEVVSGEAQGRLRVDPVKLDPLSRLGGDHYGTLGELLTLPRPR